MTHCKCFTNDGRNVKKIQKATVDHTNKDCHLKKITCCYAHDRSKKYSPPKCEKCCCVVQNCKKDVTSPRLENYDQPHQKSGKTDKVPYKEKSPEKILCEVCCCLLKNCCCREKSPSNLSRPRILCRDLPLYDEKAHLLGYIKKGAVIDHPSCAKSRDPMLDNGVAQELREKANGTICMSSCRYANGVQRQNRTAGVPRWTTKSAFEYSARTDRPTSPNKSKTKKCPC